MHELPPTGVRGRVGISFKLGVFVLPKLPLFHRRMRISLFVYYLGFRSLSLCHIVDGCVYIQVRLVTHFADYFRIEEEEDMKRPWIFKSRPWR